MATIVTGLTARPAWKALEAHYSRMCGVHLRTLFAEDSQRGERFAAEGAGNRPDYSKRRITAATVAPPEELPAHGAVAHPPHEQWLAALGSRRLFRVPPRVPSPRRRSLLVCFRTQ